MKIILEFFKSIGKRNASIVFAFLILFLISPQIQAQRFWLTKNDGLYVASADKYNSGNGGFSLSDDNGMRWKHINVTIDGRNAINDHLKVGNTFSLLGSLQDSMNFSFS